MNAPPLKLLSQRFSDLSVQALRIGLQAEAYAASEVSQGDGPGQGHQAAMINLCSSIEAAAKCIIATVCPLAVFDLTVANEGRRVCPKTIARVMQPDFTLSELHRMLAVHSVLGFSQSLQVAMDLDKKLEYPVPAKILAEARNQAIHSLVLDELRETDLIAISALHMHRHLKNAGLVSPETKVKGVEYERLDAFLQSRKGAAASAHDKIRKAQKNLGQSPGNPSTYSGKVASPGLAYPLCGLCGTRGKLAFDDRDTAPQSGMFYLVDGSLFRLVQPFAFDCPGCKILLNGLEISEAWGGLEVSPLTW